MKTTKDIAMYVLAGIIVIGFFVILAMMFLTEIPQQNKDILNVIIGALATCFIAIVNYFFGSSKSSSDKTDLLAKKDATN